jgi:CHAD domain-containing protein
MSFQLNVDEKIPKRVRSIVRKRIDKALKVMTARSITDRAVHEARKRFKEIRGTLRLVRGELGNKCFRRENGTFRDAGRPLSALRDAKVLLDTLEGLVAHFDGRVKPQSLATVKRTLRARRRETRKRVLAHDRAAAGIVKSIRAAKRRVDDWPLKRKGWKAIAGGLRTTYSRASAALASLQADPSDDAWHEWRKRTKDLRYALELLQPIWPETIEPLADQAHRLTDLLGDDHYLCVLRMIVQEDAEREARIDAQLLFALIDERRKSLQSEALELGRKLYEEDSQAFLDRMRGYWKAARGARDGGNGN